MKFFSQFSSILLSSLLVINPLFAQSPSAANAPEIQLRVVESNGISVQAGSQTAKAFTVQVADAAGVPVADAAVVVRLPDDGPSGTFGDGTHAAIVYTDSTGLAHFGNISWSPATGGMAIKITATKGESHAGMLLDGTITSGPQAMAAVPLSPVPAPETITADKPVVEQPVVAKPAVIVAPPLPVPVQQPGAVQNPARALVPPPVAASQTEPTVSVINRGAHDKGERIDTGSHKKWIILAIVIAAGAGAGIAMAGHGKSSSSSSSSASTGVSIGSPTVSVGAP